MKLGALDKSKIAALRPHPKLLSYYQGFQYNYRPIYASVNGFLKNEAFLASQQTSTRPSEEGFCAIEIGPRQFADFPLHRLLNRGRVIGVDIDRNAMCETRNSLPKTLRQRLVTLPLDVSLFASRYINELEKVFLKTPNKREDLSFDKIYSAVDRVIAFLEKQSLPFTNESVDFFDISYTFDHMTALSVNVFIHGILLEIYEAEQINEFFGGTNFTDFSQYATGQLYLALTKRYFEEIFRILKQGGVAMATDRQIITDAEFKESSTTIMIETDRLNPMESRLPDAARLNIKKGRNLEQIVQEPKYFWETKNRSLVRISVGEREDRLEIDGLGNFRDLARAAGLDIVDHFTYWNPLDVDLQKITLDEAVIVQKPF